MSENVQLSPYRKKNCESLLQYDRWPIDLNVTLVFISVQLLQRFASITAGNPVVSVSLLLARL